MVFNRSSGKASGSGNWAINETLKSSQMNHIEEELEQIVIDGYRGSDGTPMEPSTQIDIGGSGLKISDGNFDVTGGTTDTSIGGNDVDIQPSGTASLIPSGNLTINSSGGSVSIGSGSTVDIDPSGNVQLGGSNIIIEPNSGGYTQIADGTLFRQPVSVTTTGDVDAKDGVFHVLTGSSSDRELVTSSEYSGCFLIIRNDTGGSLNLTVDSGATNVQSINDGEVALVVNFSGWTSFGVIASGL